MTGPALPYLDQGDCDYTAIGRSRQSILRMQRCAIHSSGRTVVKSHLRFCDGALVSVVFASRDRPPNRPRGVNGPAAQAGKGWLPKALRLPQPRSAEAVAG